jgi:hypothetical protein
VVVVVLVVVVMLPLVMVMVIFGFRKIKRKGLVCLAYAATAKSLEASSRSSQKTNGDRYKGVLLLLSLKP